MKKIYTGSLLFLLLLTFEKLNAQVISQLSFYSPLISTFDMKYSNNHLVVSQNGLLIFDVSNPKRKPNLVAQKTYPGSIAYSVAVKDNYAYMGFGNNGIFAVYDISNFDAPALKGSVAIPSLSFYGAGDIELHGSYAYLSGFDSLYIVNVSNAASPVLANVLPVEHTEFAGAEDMAVESNSLFIKTPSSIQVYDLSNPALPALISSINYLHTYNNQLVTDTIQHRLFLSWATALKDFTGYDAYDVSNPSAVNYLFSDSTEFSPGDFGIMDYSYFNNVLFVSRGGSINAFDVSGSHHYVTTFSGQDIPNASVSIQVRDSVFFHARGGGLEVLKYSETPLPVCNATENLKQIVHNTTAFLHWRRVDRAESYIVAYRKIGTKQWIEISSKDNFQKLKDLKPDTDYTWRVKTICGFHPSKSDWSLYNIFHVKKTDLNSLITFAPNPVKDVMHVHIKDASVSQIILTDFMGKPLIKTSVQSTDQNINLSGLHTGIYVLQLLDKNNIIIGTGKMFKD